MPARYERQKYLLNYAPAHVWCPSFELVDGFFDANRPRNQGDYASALCETQKYLLNYAPACVAC